MRPPLTPLGLAAYVLVNSLLLAGLAWSAVRQGRGRPAPPEAAPIAVFAAVAIVVHLPPSASPRMLLPVIPALMWLVAQGVAASGAGRRREAIRLVRRAPREGHSR
jgi:hypothetical protein